MPVDLPSTPISLIAGWNWLGYLPQNPGDIATALAGLGDNAEFINSQADGSSTNYAIHGGGWAGMLETLEPGVGYLLKMSVDDELIYPDTSSRGNGEKMPSRRGSGNSYVFASTGQPYHGKVIEVGGIMFTTTGKTKESNSQKVILLGEYNKGVTR
jgi:hypothetical protein